VPSSHGGCSSSSLLLMKQRQRQREREQEREQRRKRNGVGNTDNHDFLPSLYYCATCAA